MASPVRIFTKEGCDDCICFSLALFSFDWECAPFVGIGVFDPSSLMVSCTLCPPGAVRINCNVVEELAKVMMPSVLVGAFAIRLPLGIS